MKAKQWLLQTGWSIEAHRVRIARVEVDLLARDPSGLLHIVEVKSDGSLPRGIVSQRQLQRLERVAKVIAEQEPIEMLVLVVTKTGQILKIPLY